MYCAAKFAVEGFTESMASYMTKGFNINFTLVEPGGIRSEFANSALGNIASTGGVYNDEYKPLLESYIGSASIRQDVNAYQSSYEVADVIVNKAIEVSNPPIRIRTSEWAEELCKLKTASDPYGLILQKYVESKFM